MDILQAAFLAQAALRRQSEEHSERAPAEAWVPPTERSRFRRWIARIRPVRG